MHNDPDRSGQFSFFGLAEDTPDGDADYDGDGNGGLVSDEALKYLAAVRKESNMEIRDFLVDPSVKNPITMPLKSTGESKSYDQAAYKSFDSDHGPNEDSETAPSDTARYKTLDDVQEAHILARFLSLRERFRAFDPPEDSNEWAGLDPIYIKDFMLENDVDYELLGSLELKEQLDAVKALEKLSLWRWIANPQSQSMSRRAQKWIFATLARLEDFGTLNADDLSVVRRLCSNIVRILEVRVKNMREGKFETEVELQEEDHGHENDDEAMDYEDENPPEQENAAEAPQELDHDQHEDPGSQEDRMDEDEDGLEHEDEEPEHETSDGEILEEEPVSKTMDRKSEATRAPAKFNPEVSAIRQIYKQGLEISPAGAEHDPDMVLGKLHKILHQKHSPIHNMYMSALCCLDMVLLVGGRVYGQQDYLNKRGLVQEAIKMVPF